MSDHTTTSIEYKICGAGDECVHPEGPRLPATEKHFYFTKHGNPRKFCKECAKARRRQYHEERREYENARSREYAKNNPGRYELYRKNYYIRKAEAVQESYAVRDLDVIYKRQGGRCWWCQEFVGLRFEIDHRVPLSRGGKDDISNIVVACGKCNREKGDKLPQEWNGRLL